MQSTSLYGFLIIYARIKSHLVRDPIPNWSGELRGPHCGKDFHITLLDEFKEAEVSE